MRKKRKRVIILSIIINQFNGGVYMNKKHLILKGIENYINEIEKTIGEPNKSDIMRFYKFIENKDYGLSYKIQILRYLCQLGQILNKPFKEVNRDDMVDYMEQIRKPREIRIGVNVTIKSYSAGTMRSIIGIVKYFFQWLNENEWFLSFLCKLD